MGNSSRDLEVSNPHHYNSLDSHKLHMEPDSEVTLSMVPPTSLSAQNDEILIGESFSPPSKDQLSGHEGLRRERRDASFFSAEREAMSCGASNCSRLVCLVKDLKAKESIVVTVKARLWVDTIEQVSIVKS